MSLCRVSPRFNLKITTLVASSVLLTSCAVPLTREERIGPDDGSDACRTYVVALDSTGNFFAEDMIKGAVQGAAAGAIAGGLMAAMSGQSGSDIGKGALIGAAVGGVAGAIGGYYKSRMEQGRDQAVLSISNDLEREAQALDKTDIAIQKLIACRVSQRDRIRSDYISKRISRSEAQSRWSQLQTQVERDNRTMQMVAENIGKRQDEYAYASEQMAEQFDISNLPPQEQAKARKRMAMNEKQIDQEYSREVNTIEREYKISKKRPSPEAEHAKKQRLASAQAAREKKKAVNRKTGGSPQAVKLAAQQSDTRGKANSALDNAKNYPAKVALGGNDGFDKADTRFWKENGQPYVALPPVMMKIA